MKLGVNGRFYGVPVWGVQRVAREVCARILDRDPAPAVFLPAGVPPPDPGLPGTVDRGRLPGHLWEQVELPWRCRRAGCDVVLNVSGTAPRWGGPHVVLLHDLFPLTHPQWYSRAFVWWFHASVLRSAARAAMVLVPSRWVYDRVVERLGIPESRLRVVGQGTAPFQAPATATEVARVRERFGLKGPYLLALGGDDPRKNVRFLQEVLSSWDRHASPHGRPTLVVVGEHRRRVHGLTRIPRDRGGLHGNGAHPWRRLGYVGDEELHALYTGARAFCFPSLAEGFGRPPLEAMACGTPAVVADYGPAREVLGDAAVIQPLDPDRWVPALAELIGDGEGRRRRVAAGLRQAARWSWDDAATAVLEACREAAGPRRSTPAGRPS